MTKGRAAVWSVAAGAVVLLAVALAVVAIEWGPGRRDIGPVPGVDAGTTTAHATGGSGGSGEPVGAAVTGRPKRLPTAEAREQLRRAIEAARRRREQREAEELARRGGGPGGGGTDQPPPGHLSKEYIQATVREVVPLIRECYEMALEDQDQFEGTIRVHFTIAGEPDVAGLVEAAEIEPPGGDGGPGVGGADADGGAPRMAPGADLSECLRQTILSLEFPAPEGGGVVNVTYPLRFSRVDAGR